MMSLSSDYQGVVMVNVALSEKARLAGFFCELKALIARLSWKLWTIILSCQILKIQDLDIQDVASQILIFKIWKLKTWPILKN